MTTSAPKSGERTMRPRTLSGIRATIAAGTVAGSAGGVLMALVLVVRALVLGATWWGAFAVFGTALLPIDSHAARVTAALLGLVVHAAASVFFGIGFAFLVARRASNLFLGRVAAGIGAALVVLVVMTFAVVPVVAPALYDGIARDWTTWVFAHVAYGVGLAYAPVVRRAIVTTRPAR